MVIQPLNRCFHNRFPTKNVNERCFRTRNCDPDYVLNERMFEKRKIQLSPLRPLLIFCPIRCQLRTHSLLRKPRLRQTTICRILVTDDKYRYKAITMVKRCCYGLCKTDSRYPERLEGVTFIPFPKKKHER